MIPAVTPLFLVAFGLLALLAGFGVLRTLGPAWRVGRLLGAARMVSVAEAIRLAATGGDEFVGITGRVDSETDFEDADHRPLVLRRTRLQARRGRSWTTFEDSLEAVPFEIREGLDGITVDATSLGTGLVVVPRHSVGSVGDFGDRAPEALPNDAPARAVIEQVSSVEHAIVLGRPAIDADGRPRMTAGRARPLILTTMELPEAMRVLVGGERRRPRVATALLAIGVAAVVVGAAWWAVSFVLLATPAAVLAATPGPSGLAGADTRSSGQGPGLVGQPGLAIAAVVAIGVVAVVATVAWIRLTPRPGEGPRPPR
jgi:hypothetical protein